MTTKEIWKTIKNYPNHQVSNLGKVRYKKSKQIKDSRVDSNGYHQIFFGDDIPPSSKKAPLLHRLVLETFVGPCPKGHETRHLDGNKSNNIVKNLCWGTRAENIEDKLKHGTQPKGTQVYKAVINDNIAEYIKKNQTRFGIEKLVEKLGVTRQVVVNVMEGKTWKHVKVEGWVPIDRTGGHKKASLTKEQVEEARKLKKKGWTYNDLVEKYGCSQPTLCKVINRRGIYS